MMEHCFDMAFCAWEWAYSSWIELHDTCVTAICFGFE